jgi:TP901 family phage tail tape measure protein
MADQESTIRITAEDNTAPALRSMSANWIKTQDDLKKGFATLADGSRINLKTVEEVSKKTGVPLKTIMAEMNRNAESAKAMGKTLAQVEREAGTMAGTLGRLRGHLHAGATAFGMVALKAGGAALAFETARRGFMGFANFERDLRHIENQTGVLRGEAKALGDEFRRLERVTGTTKNEMLSAFEELREAGNLTPEQTKKILPDLAIIAKGMKNTTAPMFARAVGDMLRNLKIPAEEAGHVMEMLSHASKEYNLDISKIGPQLSHVTEMAAAWGYSGLAGARTMVAVLGTVKEATGDAATAASTLSHLLANLGNEQLGKALGFAPGEYYKAMKMAKDPLAATLKLIAEAKDPAEVMRAIGIRDELIIAKLTKNIGEISKRVVELRNAKGALARGEYVTQDSLTAVERLSASITHLIETVGLFLDTIGTTTVLNSFATALSNIAETIQQIIEGLAWITGQGDIPSFMPKSLGEAVYWYRAPKDKYGKRLMEYDEYQAGGDPRKAREAYEKKEAEQEKQKEIEKKKREEIRDKRRREELRRKGLYAPEPEPLPPIIEEKRQKVGAAVEDVKKELVSLAAAQSPEKAMLMKAGLYNLGAAPSKDQYGGSADVKYLRASYTPSGRGYFGDYGAGGGRGTGYGGGTRLAPPSPGGPTGPGQYPGGGMRPSGPPAPPGAPRQGVPEGPGAPPPAGPGEPLPEGYKGLVDPITGKLGGGLGDYRSGGGGHAHQGVDLLAPHGSAIYAAGAGTIIKHSPHGSYQKDAVTTIRLDDGRTVRYMHHKLDPRLKVGDRLTPGQPIGTSGTAAGVGHLHYEMRDPQGRLMDPIKAHEWARGKGGRTPVGGQASGAPAGPGAPPPATAQPAPPSPGAPAAPGAQAAPVGPGAPDGPGSAPITAGPGGVVDQEALNRRLEHLISQDPNLDGYMPQDAAKYGFKSGSAKEWAGLMTGMAGKESSFRAGLAGDKGKFGGAGSTGLFQLSPQDAITYGLQKTPFTQAQLRDPDFNARMAVKIAGIRARAGGIGGREGMAKYWAGHGKPGSYLARGDVKAGKDTGVAAAPSAPAPGTESTFIPRRRGLGDMKFGSPEYNAEVDRQSKMPLVGGDSAGTSGPMPQVGGDRAPGGSRMPLLGPDMQKDVNINLNVNDAQMQFARATMRRQADREVREARWNSYADIGAA